MSAGAQASPAELADHRDLWEGMADCVRLQAELRAKKALVVTIARRLTEDWRLSDEQAVTLAGSRTFTIVRPGEKKG